MTALNRLIGIVLIVIGAIVALNLILEPLYHTSTPESPASAAWDYINPLCAISIILGMIFSYIRMSGAGADSTVQEFIAANTLFYGFLFAAILFFRSWFSGMDAASDFTSVNMATRTLIWVFFDAVFPLLSGALGVYLLRTSSSE